MAIKTYMNKTYDRVEMGFPRKIDAQDVFCRIMYLLDYEVC